MTITAPPRFLPWLGRLADRLNMRGEQSAGLALFAIGYVWRVTATYADGAALSIACAPEPLSLDQHWDERVQRVANALLILRSTP
jgi:hypothetical protein